jgi:hypothetical protein
LRQKITPATTQEGTWLDTLSYEPGVFYLMDRRYVDYGRLHCIERARACQVTRAKSGIQQVGNLRYLTCPAYWPWMR